MYKIIFILISTFLFFLFSCVKSQDYKDNHINISEIKGSLISNDHTAEGILVTHSDGSVEHFFRLDPGLNGNHTGDGGKIVRRKSFDNGLTWTRPVLLYDSKYDDRNIRGGMTESSNILIFFRQYRAITRRSIRKNFLQSNDGGVTWPDRINLDSMNLCNSCFISDYFIKIKDNFYMLSQTIKGYIELHYFSVINNKIVWSDNKYVFDYRGKMNIDEPRFANIGNGKIIGLFRDDDGTNYYQSVSTDYGNSWSVPQKTNLCNNLFSPNPEIIYDEKHNLVIAIGTDRGEPYSANSVWIYANRPDELFDNPTGYTLIKKIVRPMPSDFRFYGYPTSTRLNNGDYLIVFTECYLKKNNKENADFYQFTISFK